MEVSVKLRKAALLCAIAGAHFLVLRTMFVSSSRGVRITEEAHGILFFVEIPEPEDISPTTSSSLQPQLSPFDSRLESEAPDNAITMFPEMDASPIDWDAEARRVAGEVAGRKSAEEQFRSLDRRPPGMGAPPPKSSGHERGDVQRLEGGVIIDWASDRCYYTNQNYSSPYLSGPAFGPALRLQLPTCTGASSGGVPLPTFEEWKKQRDELP